MAMTRTVKQAKEADLPAEDAPDRIQFLSDGTDGYGHGEPIAIPADRTFVVTKPVNFEQLVAELEQAVGQPVQIASYQPPTDDDRVGPVPGSKEYPITVYVRCADGDEEITKAITTVLTDHRADPDWQHPALSG